MCVLSLTHFFILLVCVAALLANKGKYMNLGRQQEGCTHTHLNTICNLAQREEVPV